MLNLKNQEQYESEFQKEQRRQKMKEDQQIMITKIKSEIMVNMAVSLQEKMTKAKINEINTR